ncbi:sugar O-acetyltransferase [Sphingobacterium shayense]|uniref:sugar O-acetyltransferase n=1 Tax=Sphingobacterium shayense TaxID=626343 RepID=UPI0015526D4B|nr:sugar O-acetyltransferase [Sphingobacterium shayense]NQD69843.1 sugar O-acetyltransferase [Sphingobacterium shayense]
MENEKTAKQKMISGELHQPSGKELAQDRQRAREQMNLFNNLEPSKIKQRAQILKSLFAKTTSRLYVEPPLRVDYGFNISVGDNFYANFNLTILDSAPVTIGDNVMFGPNVSLFTPGHPVDAELRMASWEYAKPISIGDNVWIGGNTVVNPGVKIGKNTVIGSGSVVTKDIPDNVVAAGNPCRVLRPISDRDKIYYFKQERFPENLSSQ